MSSEQVPDSSELLNDIRYVNQITKEEIKRSDDHLRKLIDNASLPETVVDSLVGEISTQLGKLTVKANLTEKAVRALQSRQKPIKKARPVVSHAQNNKQSSYLRFDADQLADNKNLLPLEESGDGISYCWSGANPETHFSFSLNRTKVQGMFIRLFALIKPAFSKQLKVIVDGQQVRHLFRLDGALFVVSCILPPSEISKQTEIKIILPDTHSPTDVGSTLDGRKLGMAISEISFGEPESTLSHWLKRLKLKS